MQDFYAEQESVAKLNNPLKLTTSTWVYNVL